MMLAVSVRNAYRSQGRYRFYSYICMLYLNANCDGDAEKRTHMEIHIYTHTNADTQHIYRNTCFSISTTRICARHANAQTAITRQSSSLYCCCCCSCMHALWRRASNLQWQSRLGNNNGNDCGADDCNDGGYNWRCNTGFIAVVVVVVTAFILQLSVKQVIAFYCCTTAQMTR